MLSIVVVAVTMSAVPVAAAADTCTYDAGTGIVTAELESLTPGAFKGLALFLSGDRITLESKPCGDATRFNTDRIVIFDNAGDFGVEEISIHDPASFAPGATHEPGSSDEIEFTLTGTAPSPPSLLLNFIRAPAALALGSSASTGATLANFNGNEANGVDVDLEATNISRISADAHSLLESDSIVADGSKIEDPSLAGGVQPLEDSLIVLAGRDDDRVVGGDGRNEMVGGYGADVLVGGASHDVLEGLGGPDRLVGGGRRDDLNGGRGRDRCRGGSGRDTLMECE